MVVFSLAVIGVISNLHGKTYFFSFYFPLKVINSRRERKIVKPRLLAIRLVSLARCVQVLTIGMNNAEVQVREHIYHETPAGNSNSSSGSDNITAATTTIITTRPPPLHRHLHHHSQSA